LDDAFNSGTPISGVVVAAPTAHHYSIAKSALTRSIPCFIEKPLTLDVNKSRELADLAQKNNVYAQMGFVLRFVATFNRLHSLVEAGVLGKVRSYVARMNGNVITKSDNRGWRTNFAAGGGCLNEYGPHLIDLCRFIFGEVSELGAATKSHVYSTRADDAIDLTWVHESGCVGDVSLNWCDKSKRKSVIEFDVDFEYAQVTVDNSALKVVFKDLALLTSEQRLVLTKPDVPPRVSFYLRGEEFSLQLETFLENCLHKKFRVDDTFGLGNQALIQDGVAVDILIDSIAKKVGLQ
jgi:predicted dehydrogenase